MGYESKVYIVERKEWQNEKTGKKTVFGDVVAVFDLSKMGGPGIAQEFYGAFKRPIDYEITVNVDGDTIEPSNVDRYGEHMRAADIKELIDALAESEKREHYRRIPPLCAMLGAFLLNAGEWEGLEAVHFGY